MAPLLVSDINSRVRALESKYNLLAEHILVVNRNLIEEYRNITEDIKRINLDLKDMKIEMEKIKTALKGFAQEIQNFARKDDLKVLEKYINLWNPMDFVTSSELDNALRNIKSIKYAEPKTAVHNPKHAVIKKSKTGKSKKR